MKIRTDKTQFIPRETVVHTVAYLQLKYLEKISEGGMNSGVGNKRQGVIRQKLYGLAQCCSSGLQVLFEMGNPLLKLGSVLDKNSGSQIYFMTITKRTLSLLHHLLVAHTHSLQLDSAS